MKKTITTKKKVAPKATATDSFQKLSKEELAKELVELGEEQISYNKALSEAARKTAEVLKFLIKAVDDSTQKMDTLTSIINDADELNGIKIKKDDINAKNVCDAVNTLLKDEFAKADAAAKTKAKVKAEEEANKNKPLRYFSSRETADLATQILEESKYDFSNISLSAKLVPSATPYVSFTFSVPSKETPVDGVLFNAAESFNVKLSADKKETVTAFDALVDNMVYISVPLKKTCQCNKKCACKTDAPKATDTTKPVKPAKSKKAKKPAKATKPVATAPDLPAIDDLKATLLKGSKYNIPATRFKIVADHINRKNGAAVYECRFFQKNYRRYKDQPYETAPLNLYKGERGGKYDLLVKRFDKIVEGLDFDQFETK